MTAVPNVRAGFMLAPVNLIAPKWPTVTAKPIANGAIYLESSSLNVKKKRLISHCLSFS